MAKKKKKVQEDSSGGADFMTLFTALSVILLAFFILLTTMAVIDDSKKRKALGSLRGSFGILNGGMVFEKKGKYLERRKQIMEDITVLDRLVKDMEVIIQARQLGQEGDVEMEQGGVYPRLKIASSVLYPTGGTEISPKAFPVLDKIALAAMELDRTMVVEGHTGARPAGKNPALPTNWELSAFRAVNIQRYMLDAAKVPVNRVEAEGMGGHRPQNDKPADSRVVIVFRDQEDLTQEKTKGE